MTDEYIPYRHQQSPLDDVTNALEESTALLNKERIELMAKSTVNTVSVADLVNSFCDFLLTKEAGHPFLQSLTNQLRSLLLSLVNPAATVTGTSADIQAYLDELLNQAISKATSFVAKIFLMGVKSTLDSLFAEFAASGGGVVVFKGK